MVTRLSLPHVTYLLFETRDHDLARLSLDDSLAAAEFGEVIVFSNRTAPWRGSGARVVKVPDFGSFKEVSEYTWYEMPAVVRTSHFALFQYDSWVIDPKMWSDDFLKYDFIGAPWWYTDGLNVGGGVFLRSRRLADLLRTEREALPHADPEDDVLSRRYRRALEQLGMNWAPEAVAYDFAFERTRPRMDSRHFAFHGMFNWTEVLSPYRLRERFDLAASSERIRGKVEFRELQEKMRRGG